MNNINILNSYLVIRLREIKHKICYKYKSNRMEEGIKRYKSCKGKKTKKQIRKEINICKKFWGCYPLHYYRYDLYKKEKEISKEELINYIPEFFFYNVFLPYFDPNKYSILLEDKNITEKIFRSLNIKQPYTICKIIKGEIYSYDMKEKTFPEIEEEFKNNKYNKIFIKPVDGEGGYGIKIFHITPYGNYINENMEELNAMYLYNIAKENDYIIQEGIIQDESISNIYSKSINTFRIATENIKGRVRIICSVLRIGKDGKELDNCSQDGIAIGLDINGICNEYGYTEEGKVFYKHPDTNFIFKDFKIKNYDDIKKFTLESASKLPEFTYLGWDIALTKDGPIAIETNIEFGLDLYQIPLGGLREAFKINDPNMYRKTGGKF